MIPALLLCFALAQEPPPSPLDGQAYAFCHKEGADRLEVLAWCEMLEDAPPDVCPGMRATCAAGLELPPIPEGPDGGCEGERRSRGGGVSEPEKTPDHGVSDPWTPPECSCSGPDLSFLDVFLRWMAAAAVAAVVVVIVRLVWLAWDRRALTPPPPALPPGPPVLLGIEGDDDLPALPEDELMQLARDALRDGRIGEAVVYARGAALRRLARRGLVRLHVARTDREYLRAVASDAATATALRQVLVAVEDLRWAGARLTAERALTAVEAAAKILAVAFGALLWAHDAGAETRYGPDGDTAFGQLLRDAGYEVTWFGEPMTELDDEIDVLFLDVEAIAPDDAGREALAAWVRSGGLLVVNDPAVIPLDGVHRWGGGAPGACAAEPEGDACAVRWPGGSMRVCGALTPLLVQPEDDPDALVLIVEAEEEEEPAQAVEPEEGKPKKHGKKKRKRAPEDSIDEVFDAVVDAIPTEPAAPPVCEAPMLVGTTPLGEGDVVVVADSRIFLNAALIPERNRVWLAALLAGGEAQGHWDLDEAPRVALALVAGEPDESPIRALANLRLLPFVLQLLLTWALLALSRGVHFAAPRDPPEATRRAFAEHARALGRGWMSAGGLRYAASAWAKLWVQRLDRDGIVRAATRRGRDEDDAARLASEVIGLASSPDALEQGDETRIVEELWNVTRTLSR